MMNDKLLKLLELLDLVSESKIFNGKLHGITVNKADNSWFFDIEFKKVLEIEDFLTESGEIPSDFVLAVCRKKT